MKDKLLFPQFSLKTDNLELMKMRQMMLGESIKKILQDGQKMLLKEILMHIGI